MKYVKTKLERVGSLITGIGALITSLFALMLAFSFSVLLWENGFSFFLFSISGFMLIVSLLFACTTYDNLKDAFT